jgi:hypothetical protein
MRARQRKRMSLHKTDLYTLIVRAHDRHNIPIGKVMRVALQAVATGTLVVRNHQGSLLKLEPSDCDFVDRRAAEAESQDEVRWWTKPTWSWLKRLYVNDSDFSSWLDDELGTSDLNVEKLDPKLSNAIRNLLKTEQPGRTIQWNAFCDKVRDNCDGWKDRKNCVSKRGFGDKTIKRVVKSLRSGELKDKRYI